MHPNIKSKYNRRHASSSQVDMDRSNKTKVPSRAASSVVLDSIMTYYTGNTADRRYFSPPPPSAVVDWTSILDVGEFPLPPGSSVVQVKDWDNLSTISQHPYAARRIQAMKDEASSIPEVPQVPAKYASTRKSGAAKVSVDHSPSVSTLPMKPTRPNRFSHHSEPAKYHSSSQATALVVNERYPTIAQNKIARGSRRLSYDQRYHPSGMAQKGTFAAPLSATRRTTSMSQRQPSAGHHARVSTSPALRAKPSMASMITTASEMPSEETPVVPTPTVVNDQARVTTASPSSLLNARDSDSDDILVAATSVRTRSSSKALRTRKDCKRPTNGRAQKATNRQQQDANSPESNESSPESASDSVYSPRTPHNGGHSPEAYNFYGPLESQILFSPDMQSVFLPADSTSLYDQVDEFGVRRNDRKSLIEQGHKAQASRTSGLRGHTPAEATTGNGPPSKSWSRRTSSKSFTTQQRHADVVLMSPQPEHPILQHSSDEGIESLLSFEEYLNRQVQNEQAQRTSTSKRKSVPNQPRTSRSKTKRSSTISCPGTTAAKQATALELAAAWPLPPVKFRQPSPRQRSCTSPASTTSPSLSSSPRQLYGAVDGIHSGSSLGIQRTIDEIVSAQTNDAHRISTGLGLYTNNNASLFHQNRSLPRLPYSPLDDWETAGAVPKPLRKSEEIPRRHKHYTKLSHESSVPPLPNAGRLPLSMGPPSIVSDDQEPSSFSEYPRSTDESIPDAYMISSQATGLGVDRPFYRWSGSSFGAGGRRTTDVKREEIAKPIKKEKQSRVCGTGWSWFWQTITCGSNRKDNEKGLI